AAIRWPSVATDEDDMTSNHHPRQGRGRTNGRAAPRSVTPEQSAADRAEALQWRARLREAAAAGPAPETPEPGERPRVESEARRRGRFAAAIARAEFGRFYRAADRGAGDRPPGPNSTGRPAGRS